MQAPKIARCYLACLPALWIACAGEKPPARAPAPPVQAAPPAEIIISIIGTSDLHGHVEPTTFMVKDAAGREQEVTRGGLPLLGGYVANLRKQRPVLLLDAGDLFQGTLTSNLGEGQAVIDAYNVLGYTAVAIGNHEFDYGPEGAPSVPRQGGSEDPTGALKARIAAARFPVLSANVLDDATGKAVTWPNVQPSRMITIAGVPIGLVGATAEDTPRTTNAMNLRGLTIGKIVPAVRAEAQRLRREGGAAAVILVVHEGANCKSFKDPHDLGPCKNDDERVLSIARDLQDDVDAVVGGHSHAGVAHFVGSVAVIQAYSVGRYFGRIDLGFRLGFRKAEQPGGPPSFKPIFTINRTRTRIYPPTEVCSVAVTSAEPDRQAGGPPAPRQCEPQRLQGKDLLPATYEGRPVTPDAEVMAALAPHIERAARQRGTSLHVTASERLTRNYRGESVIGDLLADLMREGAAAQSRQRVDVAFQNGGGIRAELQKGPLTYGDLYEVLPFDNRLALMKIPGALLTELLRANLESSAGVLLPSGLFIEASCQGEKLQVTLRDDKGKPLRPDRAYTVAVSDFLASGGDNFGAINARLPPGAVTYFDDAPPLREIILAALRRHPTVPWAPPGKKRLVLPMERPVKCGAAPQVERQAG